MFWDPDAVFWTIPWIDWPIFWYGVFFAVGFACGYFVMRHFVFRQITEWELERHSLTTSARRMTAVYMDHLLWYVLVGTVVGARLGHVLFYGWPYYSAHPGEIIKIWEGGLASHGGAIGVVIALAILYRWSRKQYSMITFLGLLDMIVIPVALVGTFIRIGNFFNQEVLGVPSQVPWAVIFGHPADGSAAIPRHPVQLYEASFYLVLFFVLWWLRHHRAVRQHSGLTTGIFFVVLFSYRFAIEFIKVPEGEVLPASSTLLMGQWLSIPFIVLGIVLIIWSFCKKRMPHG